jgi:MoaA/NifB/PqqE/SkfB family radical SAM enzyme
MLKGLAKIFRIERRELEAFLIEVSTYSSLECQMCPRAVFAEQWIFQKMSLPTFQKIGQHFHLAKWVSLQGWGEPLENENVIPMLSLAKQSGCLTSLTTNGAGLTENLAHELLTADLDLLTVSLEGPTPAIPENGAAGSDFAQVLENVAGLVRIKKKLKKNYPWVRLSFLMTRLNMPELPGAVPLAAKLGVDELFFTNLDYLPNQRWNILRAFYHESPTATFEESIAAIRRLGKKEGVKTSISPLRAEEQPVCEPNPPRKVFFAVDGSIAPCMYLRLPRKGDIPRIFLNKEYRVPQTIFGNIQDEEFSTIWNKESYRNFRKIFEDREKARVDMVQILDAFSHRQPSGVKTENTEPPPPLAEVCRTCYKAYAI